MEHQVIFMRDYDLAPTKMTELGQALGTLGARHHSYVTHPESDDVVIIEWKGDDLPDAAEWHSDMTYRETPPFASILKGVVIPPAGGDTLAYTNAKTAVHPMVSHHPVTGRPYLNVSESFTRFIIGLSAPESGRLLTELFDRINRPEHHVRLRWKPNTMAIWDNRGTQHYAVIDYLPSRRVMHRVAVVEDARQPV